MIGQPLGPGGSWAPDLVVVKMYRHRRNDAMRMGTVQNFGKEVDQGNNHNHLTWGA